jgi:formate hydrogenlyase transcriptional activator
MLFSIVSVFHKWNRDPRCCTPPQVSAPDGIIPEETFALNKRDHAELVCRNETTAAKSLLFEISVGLSKIMPDEIEGKIREFLDMVSRTWALDQMFLLQWSSEHAATEPGECYSCDGWPGEVASNSIKGQIPWVVKRLRKGEAICMPCLPDDLPTYVTRDRQYFVREGIKSGMAMPLKAGSLVLGGILIFLRYKENAFFEQLIEATSCLAEILASALSRKKAADRVDGAFAYEHLLSDISATYINLPVSEVDKVMGDDLGRLARLLGADRCILYLVEEDGESFRPYLHSGWWPEEDRERVIQYNKLWDRYDPEFVDAFRYLFNRWRRGEHMQWTQRDRLPEEAERMKQAYGVFGLKSQLSVPVSVSGLTVAALTVSSNSSYKTWPEDLVPRLRLFGEVFANALARKRSEEALQKALEEVQRLKERFEADYSYLRDMIDLENDFRGIIGRSNALNRILTKVRQVAPTDATVLILGETGTGKGLIARAIHNVSGRKDRPLMQVNCAALSPNLIESELFGHEKGAFTGALSRRIGRFESARGTTLFLDEVGELPQELQAKLLRVLQDGEFERVGGSTTLRTDARIVAATNRNLEEEVKAGRFRSDLWYRLSIFPIHVPPLRERLEDIPLFLRFFVDKYGKWIGKTFDVIPQKTVEALKCYHWPGNIRELENLIERAVITSPGGHLQIDLPSGENTFASIRDETLEAFEREYITGVLVRKGWKIKGETGAANALGLKPSTLRKRMEKLGITRPARVR